MTISRRPVAAALTFAAVALFGSMPEPAAAQDSGKPIVVIVPAPGGSGTGDAIARLLGDELGRTLKTSVVIDNKAGANGNIGAAAAAKAEPDGHHLLFSWAGTLAVSSSLYRQPGFDVARDFVPVALVADVPNILVVNNELPVRTLDEFTRYARSNPGRLNYGSTGIGSSMHLAAELFSRENGVQMVHVPYSAPGAATTNLIAGDLQAMFQLVPGIAGAVKGGKVRALAVMAPRRSPALPDVPTVAEAGQPRLLSSTWFAVLAPRATPAAAVERLNAAINSVLAEPAFRQRLAEIGATPLGGTPKQLADHIAHETERWGRVVRDAKLQEQ